MAFFVRTCYNDPMEHLSSRMRAAGWILQGTSDNRWEILALDGRRFAWTRGEWSPSREVVEAQLLRDEDAIRCGKRSPFLGTTRLVQRAAPGEPTLLARCIAEKAICRGHSLLRLLPIPDPPGDALLLEAGARRVETLLAPWSAAPDDARRFPHHLVLCEHLCDTLPPSVRGTVLRNLTTWLHPQGEAYLSFFEMSAMPAAQERSDWEDGYVVERSGCSVFLKPWLPARAIDSLQREIGGNAALAWSLYDEFVLRWIPTP